MKNALPKKIPLKRSEDYYIKILLKETRLKDIMTTDIVTIRADAPFREVPRKMKESRIRHLPVVNSGGQLVGLVTQRDLFKIQPPRKLLNGQWLYDEEALDTVILDKVMIKDVFAMRPEDSMGEALVAMVKNKYGCVPVVDGDRVLRGLVTQYDILGVAAQIYLE